MKIFGRGKRDNDGLGSDDLDIVSDDAGFDDAGDGLAAPARGFGAARASGNKKFILLIVLVLLLGGGYAALSMMSEEPTPIAALPPPQPLNPEAAAMPAPVDPNAPLPVDAAGIPLPQDPALAGASPIPGTDGTLPPPLVTDAAMPPMPDMPPMPQPTDVTAAVTGVPPMPVTGQPVDPMAAAVADAIDAEAGINPAVPPPGTAVVDEPPVPAGSAPGDVPPPPPVMAAADGAVPNSMPPPGEATGGIVVPARDPALAPARSPAANPSLDGAAIAASDAEQALLDNADLIPPAEDAGPRTPEEIAELWASLPTEQAMVRPLPEKYLTVQKESGAESLDSRLASARRALHEGRASSALQFFNELRADFPNDTRVLMGRAVALQRIGQHAEALQAYEEVLRADPKNLDALTNMLGLLKTQNPAMAIEKLQALRSVYPYSADITTQLAISYGDGGDLNEALRYITLAEALKPDSGYVLYNKAIIYDRLGRRTEAGDMYRQLIRSSADGSLDQNLPMESIKRRLADLR